MDEFLILLQAKLDEAKSIANLNGANGDIAVLQGKLNALKLQATLDPDAAQKLVNDIGKLINQKITISNINIDTNQAVKNAQQSGQQIGRQIQNGINSVVQKGNFTTEFTFSADKRNNVAKVAQEEFQKIANGIVTVKEQMTKVDSKSFLDGFIVNIKKANGEIESLTYRLKDMLDSQGKATGKSFQYVGGSINDNGVIKQLDAISAKADNLQTKLDKLKANYSDINSSRPIKDSNNISALSQQYDKVSQAIENVRNADNTTFSSMVSNAQREITALESMVAQFRNAENVATQMKSVDISSGIAQAQERLGKLKADSTGFEQMTHTLRELDAAITNVGDKSSLDAFIDKLRVAETQLSRVKAETKSMALVNKIQLSMETGGYESKVESLIARTRQWTDSEGQARINTAALSDAMTKLTQASEAYANNKSEATQKRLIESSKKLDTEYQKITNDVRKMNAEMAKDSAISSLHNQVNDFMSKNGKAVKYSGEFMRIFNETAQGAKLTREEIAKLNQEFNTAVVQARNAGKLGKTFFQTLREGMSSFSYWTSSTFLVMKAIQSVKGGLGTVKALDTALVDLKKTTTMTNSELEDFYYSSNKVAKQMGVTTKEIISQASAWSRLGFSSEAMATKMAKYSSMFASISPGLDLDSATDGLVSTMKAFSIGLDNADDVVDGIMSKINIIGNSKALNNSDIVDFLTRSSSALASANNSIEESIAMGEAIVEITRDAAGAGQVMKTTSMRIRGYDEEVEAYTEELENLKGEIADLTKTAKTPGGISLFTDETKETYKSTYKILEEISVIWDDLTDKNQAQLLEVLAGKRNGQALAALISNFKSAQESMDLMADSAGNAEKEMSVIMDSLDFKLNRLSETGTSVAQNLFKRNDMKTVVDGLTSVMNVIDSLTSKLGLFGSIGLGAGIFAGLKNVGGDKMYSLNCYLF